MTKPPIQPTGLSRAGVAMTRTLAGLVSAVISLVSRLSSRAMAGAGQSQ